MICLTYQCHGHMLRCCFACRISNVAFPSEKINSLIFTVNANSLSLNFFFTQE